MADWDLLPVTRGASMIPAGNYADFAGNTITDTISQAGQTHFLRSDSVRSASRRPQRNSEFGAAREFGLTGPATLNGTI